MARKVVITGGKGGVGKSTVCVNLGIVLARMGKRVCLVDGDFALNSLDVMTDCEQKIIFDIADGVFNRCRPKQVPVKTDVENLYLISARSYARNECVTAQSLKLLLEDLSVYFDIFLVDCPSGTDSGFKRAVSVCNEAIIVVDCSILSIRDADKVLSLLKGYQIDGVALAINRFNKKRVKSAKMLLPEQIGQELKTKVAGIITESEKLPLKNVDKTSAFSAEYRQFFALAKNFFTDNGEREI